MSEGARFPWKLQSVQQVPAVSYKNLRKPLRAPSGKRWAFDKSTKEWSLVNIPKPMTTIGSSQVVVDAVLVDENGHFISEEGEDSSTTAATCGTAPFFEHIVQETDTFEGLCIRYKVTPSDLRRANDFTGNNLLLAPSPLKIPNRNIVKHTDTEARTVGAFEDYPHALTTDQVVRLLLKECPTLSITEANAYLELNDWDFGEALQNANQDGF
jgi:LysM repeat protein